MGSELFEQIYCLTMVVTRRFLKLIAVYNILISSGHGLLHRHLAKKMSERDAFWLPFISSHYGDEGTKSPSCLGVGWRDKSKIQDASLRLAGVTLMVFGKLR